MSAEAPKPVAGAPPTRPARPDKIDADKHRSLLGLAGGRGAVASAAVAPAPAPCAASQSPAAAAPSPAEAQQPAEPEQQVEGGAVMAPAASAPLPPAGAVAADAQGEASAQGQAEEAQRVAAAAEAAAAADREAASTLEIEKQRLQIKAALVEQRRIEAEKAAAAAAAAAAQAAENKAAEEAAAAAAANAASAAAAAAAAAPPTPSRPTLRPKPSLMQSALAAAQAQAAQAAAAAAPAAAGASESAEANIAAANGAASAGAVAAVGASAAAAAAVAAPPLASSFPSSIGSDSDMMGISAASFGFVPGRGGQQPSLAVGSAGFLRGAAGEGEGEGGMVGAAASSPPDFSTPFVVPEDVAAQAAFAAAVAEKPHFQPAVQEEDHDGDADQAAAVVAEGDAAVQADVAERDFAPLETDAPFETNDDYYANGGFGAGRPGRIYSVSSSAVSSDSDTEDEDGEDSDDSVDGEQFHEFSDDLGEGMEGEGIEPGAPAQPQAQLFAVGEELGPGAAAAASVEQQYKPMVVRVDSSLDRAPIVNRASRPTLAGISMAAAAASSPRPLPSAVSAAAAALAAAAASVVVVTVSITPAPSASNENKLVSVQLFVNRVPVPAGGAAPTSAPAPISSTAGCSMPFLISREIVETEQRFVDAMQALTDCMIAPVQAAARINDRTLAGVVVLDPRVQVLFATASQILKLNSRFLLEMRRVIDAWAAEGKDRLEPPEGSKSVGAVFLHYAPLFRIFSQYAQDHEAVAALLSSALTSGKSGGGGKRKKNNASSGDGSSSGGGSAYERFVSRVQSDARWPRGLTVESILIMPIQRIPRYKLLLEELRRKSRPGIDRGYADLQQSISSVSIVASHVNETIRHREQHETLRTIEARFALSASTGFQKLVLRDREPPRVLVREGVLRRLTRKGAEDYFFHLFDDCLLYSEESPATKMFKLHRRINFAGGKIAFVDTSSATAATAAAAPAASSDVPPTKSSAASTASSRRASNAAASTTSGASASEAASPLVTGADAAGNGDEEEEEKKAPAPSAVPSAAACAAATAPAAASVTSSSSAASASASAAAPAAWSYSIEIRSPQKSFVVVFETAESKDAWLRDLQNCLAQTLGLDPAAVAAAAASAAASSSSMAATPCAFVAPVWAQDKAARTCDLCDKEFNLFNRRHHCRKCGSLVCGPCSKNKRMLPSVDNKDPVRVCDKCVKHEHESRMNSNKAAVSSAPSAAAASASPSAAAAGTVVSGRGSVAAGSGGSASDFGTWSPQIRPPSGTVLAHAVPGTIISPPRRPNRPAITPDVFSAATSGMAAAGTGNEESKSDASTAGSIGGAAASSGPSAAVGVDTVVEAEDVALAREAAAVRAAALVTESALDAIVVPPYRRTLFTLCRTYCKSASSSSSGKGAPSPSGGALVAASSAKNSDAERLLACMELYLSERTYCLELEVLLSHFVQPLLKMMVTKKSGLLGGLTGGSGAAGGGGGSAATAAGATTTQLLGRTVPPSLLLFLSSVQPLYTLSLELLNCLHAKLCLGEGVPEAEFMPSTSAPKGWHPCLTTMGELFLRYASLLELYAEFSQHHQQALALLTDPKEPFFKEVFQKLDTGVRSKMQHVIAEREKINAACLKRAAEWEREDASALEVVKANPAFLGQNHKAAAAAASSGEPVVESIDEEAIDAAINAASSVSRMSKAGGEALPPPSLAAAASASRPITSPSSAASFAAASSGSAGTAGASTDGVIVMGRGRHNNGVFTLQMLEDPLPHTSLHDLLTAPFMRVTKYVWLLSTLLKCTPEGHPDNLVGAESASAAAAGSNAAASSLMPSDTSGPAPMPRAAVASGQCGSSRLLSQALSAVQHSLNTINAAILVGDNLTLLTRLSERFVGSARELDLVSPSRLLLKHGMLGRHTRSDVTNYYFHLFNDMLVYSSLTVQGKFKLHRKLPLITLQVLDPGNGASGALLSPSVIAAVPAPSASSAQASQAQAPLSFDLEIRSPQKSFVVTAKDAAEKDAWLEEIQLAVQAEIKRHAAANGGGEALGAADAASSPSNAANSNGARESALLTSNSAAPLWVKDSSATACPFCSKKFTLLFRRHHCRQCGSICCDPCSRNRRVLPSIDAKEAVRVCDVCARGMHGVPYAGRASVAVGAGATQQPAAASPAASAAVAPAPSPAAASSPASAIAPPAAVTPAVVTAAGASNAPASAAPPLASKPPPVVRVASAAARAAVAADAPGAAPPS